jgi:hypothetical protein
MRDSNVGALAIAVEAIIAGVSNAFFGFGFLLYGCTGYEAKSFTCIRD